MGQIGKISHFHCLRNSRCMNAKTEPAISNSKNSEVDFENSLENPLLICFGLFPCV